MTNWHQEVMDNENMYLIEASVDDHGAPIPAVMRVIIDKFAPKGGIIEEPTYFSRGCKICGSITGEHGFSFDQKKKW